MEFQAQEVIVTIKVSRGFRKDLGAAIDAVLAPNSLARGAMTANRKNDGSDMVASEVLKRVRKNAVRSIRGYREAFKRIAKGK